MATYSIPYQNLNLSIPDDGQVFRTLNSGWNNPIYKRVGNKIIQIQSVAGKPAGQAYEEMFGAGSFANIQQYNEADFQTPFANLGIQYDPNPADISLFNPSSPTTQSGTITQTISPDNPNGIVVTNPQGQVVTQSPSATQALINGGATPQQAQQIAQAPQQAGTTPTGQQAGAVSTGLPQAGTTQPGVQALPNNGGAPAQTVSTNGLQVSQGGAPAPAATTGTPQAQTSTYTGPSIVDYLNSLGQPSDFSSRATLAAQHGIQNYTGTAAQNTALLNTLRQNTGVMGGSTAGGVGASVSAPASASQTGQTGTPTAPQTETGKTPMQNVIDTYNEVYKQLGLSSVKSQYEKTLKDQQDLTNKMNDEITNVNVDPWLTEGERARRVNRIQDKYASRLDTLSNFAKLYDSLYKEGQAQAQFLVGAIQDDTQAALKLAQDKQDAIDKLMTDNTVVSANGRELLVNKATGAVVADLGASKVTGANGGGQTGLVEAILANPALYNTLTPSVKSALLPQLINAGVDPSTLATGPVTPEQRQKLDDYDTLQREAQYALQVLNEGLDTGPLAGRVGLAQSALGYNQSFTQYNSAVSNLSSILLKARSGAAVTPQEYERIKGFIPLITDDQKTAETKINRFFVELADAKSNYINRITQTTQQIKAEGQAAPGVTPSGVKYTVIK